MTRANESHSEENAETTGLRTSSGWTRRDWAALGGVTLLFSLVYGATFSRHVFWYDSAEYAAAAATLGIPHPPGSPLYTIVAHAFTWLPLEPAVAVNAMSAVFGVVAVALVFCVLRELGARTPGAVIGAAALGGMRTFWEQCVVAEVYTLAVTVMLGVLWCLLIALRRGTARWLLAGSLLAGLGLGVHYSIATAGLGFALLVLGFDLEIQTTRDLRRLISTQHIRRRISVALGCALTVLLGAANLLYIIWRARQDPVVMIGDPSTWTMWWWFVTGGNYGLLFASDISGIELAGLVAGYFYDNLGVVGLLAAVGGAVVQWRRNALTGLALVAIFVGNVGFFYDYLAHDQQVFFMMAYVVAALWTGIGFDAGLRAVETHLGDTRPRLTSLAVVAALLFPVQQVALNWQACDVRTFDKAETYAEDVAEFLPENALLIEYTTPPEWIRSAVFHTYFQKLEGWRPDVDFVRIPPTEWVALQVSRGRAVFLFAPVKSRAHEFRWRERGPVYQIVAVDPLGRFEGPGDVE